MWPGCSPRTGTWRLGGVDQRVSSPMGTMIAFFAGQDLAADLEVPLAVVDQDHLHEVVGDGWHGPALAWWLSNTSTPQGGNMCWTGSLVG